MGDSSFALSRSEVIFPRVGRAMDCNISECCGNNVVSSAAPLGSLPGSPESGQAVVEVNVFSGVYAGRNQTKPKDVLIATGQGSFSATTGQS